MRKWRFRSLSSSWNKLLVEAWAASTSFWVQRACFVHLWPCSWVVLLCEFISPLRLTISLPQALLSFPFAYEGTEIQRRKLTCRTSQSWEDTKAFSLSTVLCSLLTTEESKYYELQKRIEYYDWGTRIWSQVPGGIKSGSAAHSWGVWSTSLNIAKSQFSL